MSIVPYPIYIILYPMRTIPYPTCIIMYPMRIIPNPTCIIPYPIPYVICTVWKIKNADDDAESQKFALQELFRSYNKADPKSVKVQVANVVKRLNRVDDILLGEDEIEMVEGVEVGHESGRKYVRWYCWRFFGVLREAFPSRV